MRSKMIPLLLPIRSVLFILIFLAGAALLGRNVSDISNWWSIVATAVNVVTILIIVVVARGKGTTYCGLVNLRKGQTKIRRIIIIVVIMMCVGMGSMYMAGFIFYGKLPYSPPEICEPVPAVLAVINLILLPVTTALAEDGLYLGCGVGQISNRFVSVIYPAFFFALQHSFIPLLYDWKFMTYRFLSFLPLTVIMCIDYRRNKDPLPFMVGHTLLDLATGVTILVMSVVPGLYESMLSKM